MPKSRIPSPARSQGVISTPRKRLRRTGSFGSPARPNLRLSTIIDSYKVSPLPNRQSILNDDTDIDMPRRGSWWKKIDDNSRDVLELLERKELVEINNVAEEFDVEVLSQENKNYALDLPESSDGESINSIVIPQRKLFTQKDNQPQIQFGQIKNNRETLQKLNKSYVDQDKELNIGRKTLFSQPSKPRTKPVFPAALLNISANKTANKSKDIPTAGVTGQVRNLFGGRPGAKRKNMFADFIVSESEDEILDIQPKMFAFQNRNEQKRRASSMSRHSPTSSIDLEMEEWRLLPSSTMVENHIDEVTSPVKRIKLSNLLETNGSEICTKSNNTINQTKPANKSVSSKNKSKNSSNIHREDDKSNDIHMTTPTSATTNNSRVTRSMGRSLRENSVTASNISKKLNKSKNQTQSNQSSNDLKTGNTTKNISQRNSVKVQEKESVLEHADPDEEFTLQYENDDGDNEVLPEVVTSLRNDNKSHKDKTSSNLNVDVTVDKNNIVKKSSAKISKNNSLEQEISTNEINKNPEELLENNENDMERNNASNYSTIQNNSQEIGKVVGLNNDSTNVQKVNKSIDKNKRKSITNSVEECNNKQTEKSSQEQSANKYIEENEILGKSTQNLNEENQEMECENTQNESDNNYEQHSDIEEEANDSTQLEENKDNSEVEEEVHEDEHEENETENVSEEKIDNEEQENNNDNNIDTSDQEIILDDQRDNIQEKNQITLPNVSHDTTGRHRKKFKSPEVILHDKTKHIDSFTDQARNTSVRKTKSIIFHNKIDTVTDFRKSTGFSDATGNSSAEGSGWDSHRTTRKTLRQTFGKDFTPRKSLRALVMEKTAKLQANFTEVVGNIKVPQANSTEYDQVQDELDSYQETELVQVEQNIKMIQVDENIEAIQVEKYQKNNEIHVTERLEERGKTGQLIETDKTEHLEERNEADPSKRDETELSEIRAETEQLEEKEDTEQSKEKEEVKESEERDEVEEFEEREEVEESEEREKIEESEEREEVEESEEREEVEESEERGEVGESKEREDSEESEEREEMEESGERQELEGSAEGEEMEQYEEREDMEQSEEREDMEQSEEREDIERSENEEREEMEQSEEREGIERSENEEREDMDQSEERTEIERSESEGEEMEQTEEREEIEPSENEDGDDTQQFGDRDEMERSENEDRDETEQFGERDEIEQSENETEQFEERDESVPDDEIMAEESGHGVSKQTRQTSLEAYLHKIKQDNAEKRRKMQEELRNSLKNPKRDAFNLFKVPQKPVRRTIKIQKPKAKQIKSVIPLDMLPSEVIEDMKYKPPKRFQPNNASWITKRLYKFLENRLEPKYDYKARVRAEKLVQCIYNFTKEVRRHDSIRTEGIEELKQEMARLDIVKTHFDFYEFCHEFFPREIRIKVVPDIVNNIQLPRHGVFSDILR